MDARADRRSAILQEFDRVGFPKDKIIRFPAASYNGCPNSGCLLSHANVLEMAYDMDLQNVLVLEDDFVFIDDIQKIHADIKAFFELNISWDVVMLTTCAAVVSEPTNHLISRISSSGNGAGYLVNRSMMLELSTLFKSNVENLYTTKQHWVYQNDILWKTIMPTSQWYMFNHYLGYQKEGYSDLSQDQKIAIVPQILGERSVLRAEHASAPILLCLSPPLDDKFSQHDDKSSQHDDKSSQQGDKSSQQGDKSSQQGDKSSQTVNNSYCADSIVNSVISAFIGRSNVGLQKYGTTLDRDDLSILDWIQHAQEEHMDAILYLEKLKTKLRELVVPL
jgi:GR25 family glycosyltransferase involved in LPS biosynthesis